MNLIALAAVLWCVQNAPALDGLKGESLPEQPKGLVGILGKPEEYSGDGRHQIHGIGFSPKGDLLGVAAGTSLRLWDLSGPEPKVLGTMEAAVSRGAAWAFSPDGASLAVSTRKALVCWDLRQRPPRKNFEVKPEAVGVTLSFAPDGSVLAVGSGNRVELWDLRSETPKPKATSQGHARTVDRVAFSPSGRLIASGSFSESVRIWDPARAEAKHVFKGQPGHLWSLLFSPGEERLVFSTSAPTERGKLRMWSLTDTPKETVLNEHADWIRSVVFTPDGTRMISLGCDGEIVRWTVAEGRKVDRWKLPGESLDFHAAALSPDGRYLTVVHKDTRVHVLRLGA